MKLLNLKGEYINAFSVVFAKVLSEMANGGVKNYADVIWISATGIIGPDGGRQK